MDPVEAYNNFVSELSRHPDMIKRLLDAHPAEGMCTECGLGITAPCAIRQLARRALEVRRAR